MFATQDFGITEVSEKIWLATFMNYDLGFFDHESGRIECAPNPFSTRALPMSSELSVTDVLGTDPAMDRYPSREAAIVAAVDQERRRAELRGWLATEIQKGLDSGSAGELHI